MGKGDVAGIAHIAQVVGIHRAHNGLHPGRVPQDPRYGHGSLGYAFPLADLAQRLVQFREVGVIHKCPLEKAVLQRRPGLDRDVMQAAVVKNVPVPADGEFGGLIHNYWDF